MNRKKIIFITLISLTAIGIFLITLSYFSQTKTVNNEKVTQNVSKEKFFQDAPIFTLEEFWGPCPPGDICKQTIQISASGELILTGAKTSNSQLSNDKLKQFNQKIQETNILHKNCTDIPFLDYYFQATIRDEKTQRILSSPECIETIKEIKNFIFNSLQS